MTPARNDLSQDDGLLWRRARDGEETAFGELVRRHQRRVWLVCRQYVGGDEADSATQDTFLKAFRRLESFDGRARFGTWLVRIAINTCLDRLRRRKRWGHRVEGGADDGDDPLARMPDGAADPEQRAMERQAVARLATCEEGLPARQREIFRLRFYAEMELDEIADSLGVHVGTVKTQLHRAVHRLRRELGEIR